MRALLGSRFFTEAVAVARDPRAPADARVDGLSWVKDLVLYETYVRGVKEATDRYYGDVARGTPHAGVGRGTSSRGPGRSGRACPGPVRRPPFDAKVLDGEADGALAERFGTMIASGKTGGVPNLHMGHRVVDVRHVAEQYGRRAPIRFVVLDAIVSNGYETWMWDGRGAHGGWGKVGLIVQVRPAYAEGALRGWRDLTDPERRAKADRRVAEETARDVARAAKDPFAYLPGLALRLKRQGEQAVEDELGARGLAGGALRAAFVAEVDRAVIESSIFAHEGRHAIDADLPKSQVLVPGPPRNRRRLRIPGEALRDRLRVAPAARVRRDHHGRDRKPDAARPGEPEARAGSRRVDGRAPRRDRRPRPGRAAPAAARPAHGRAARGRRALPRPHGGYPLTGSPRVTIPARFR